MCICIYVAQHFYHLKSKSLNNMPKISCVFQNLKTHETYDSSRIKKIGVCNFLGSLPWKFS